ncbi:hypothetical protein ACOMHN_031707 [Nucella lapillus]
MKMTSCCIVASFLVAACLSISYAESPYREVCPNLMQDLNVCQRHMAALSNVQDLSAVCQAGNAYITCVEQIQDRCDEIRQEMDDSLDYMKNYLETQFGCQIKESAGSESAPGSLEAAEPDESAAVECPPTAAAFNHTVTACVDMEHLTPSNMCSLLGDAITCVDGLVEACKNSEWMTPELRQSMENGLDQAKSMLRLQGCSHD